MLKDIYAIIMEVVLILTFQRGPRNVPRERDHRRK